MIYTYNTPIATNTLLEITKVFVGDKNLHDKELKLSFKKGAVVVVISRTTNRGVTKHILEANIKGTEIKTTIPGRPLNVSQDELCEPLLRFMNALDAHVEVLLDTKVYS